MRERETADAVERSEAGYRGRRVGVSSKPETQHRNSPPRKTPQTNSKCKCNQVVLALIYITPTPLLWCQTMSPAKFHTTYQLCNAGALRGSGVHPAGSTAPSATLPFYPMVISPATKPSSAAAPPTTGAGAPTTAAAAPLPNMALLASRCLFLINAADFPSPDALRDLSRQAPRLVRAQEVCPWVAMSTFKIWFEEEERENGRARWWLRTMWQHARDTPPSHRKDKHLCLLSRTGWNRERERERERERKRAKGAP